MCVRRSVRVEGKRRCGDMFNIAASPLRKGCCGTRFVSIILDRCGVVHFEVLVARLCTLSSTTKSSPTPRTALSTKPLWGTGNSLHHAADRPGPALLSAKLPRYPRSPRSSPVPRNLTLASYLPPDRRKEPSATTLFGTLQTLDVAEQPTTEGRMWE